MTMRLWFVVLLLQAGCTLDLSGLTGGEQGAGGGRPREGCLEGCPSGSCAPLAKPGDPQLSLFRLGLTADRVAFADPTAAELGLLTGAGETRVGVGPAPQAVAVFGDRLYFGTASQGVFACSLPECSDLSELVAMGPDTFARQIVADETQVYWITGPDLSDGSVYRAAVDGRGAMLIADAQVRPHGIAIDEARVYWTVHGHGDDGRIRSAPKAGGPVRDVAVGLTEPSGIAVDDDYIVYTSSAVDGAVFRCSKDSCDAPAKVTDGPALVNDPVAQPRSVAIVGGDAVWTNDGGGSVMACPIGGCSEREGGRPDVLARGLTAPGAIVATGFCLAWGAGEGIFVTGR